MDPPLLESQRLARNNPGLVVSSGHTLIAHPLAYAAGVPVRQCVSTLGDLYHSRRREARGAGLPRNFDTF
jgi:hypothetical protein